MCSNSVVFAKEITNFAIGNDSKTDTAANWLEEKGEAVAATTIHEAMIATEMMGKNREISK